MFTIRTTLPNYGDPLYNNRSVGGYSGCINGYPTKDGLNVLANCVGWACGRFNEIYNECTGNTGMAFPDLSCSAWYFPERAMDYYGLPNQDKPVAGGIMVFSKDGGEGHVMIVEQILERDNNGYPTKIFTSESGYGSSAFWNSTRTNDNGRWGLGSAYHYRCCIPNPAVKEETITPSVVRDTNVNQLKILGTSNVRTGAGVEYYSLGLVSDCIFNWYETKENGDYTWYRIAENQWVAQDINNTYLEIYYKENGEEEKEMEELKKQIAELQEEVKEKDNKITLQDKQINELIERITTCKEEYKIEKNGKYSIQINEGEILLIKPVKDTKYTVKLSVGDIVKVK